MKILLTGAHGQVGWELCRTLSPLGTLVAVTREQMDLADSGSIRRCMQNVKPDLIVNAAAYTAVDKAESETGLAHAVNAEAPAVMAEEARRQGAALVHYSTDYVFDGAKQGAYTENDPAGPLGVYGQSKLAGENAIRAAGTPHLILRTSWVYGNRGRNFLLTVLKLATERTALAIVDDQIGAPTWSRMIAETTALILARIVPPHSRDMERFAASSGTYHLTASGQTSWCGFANAILATASSLRSPVAELRARHAMPISTADYPTPAVRPRNSVLSGEKLLREFGIALPDWTESLRQCLADRS